MAEFEKKNVCVCVRFSDFWPGRADVWATHLRMDASDTCSENHHTLSSLSSVVLSLWSVDVWSDVWSENDDVWTRSSRA